jgi:hypothetical protein
MRGKLCMLFVAGALLSSGSIAQSSGGTDAAFIAVVVDALQKLCGMKGASTDIKVKGIANVEGSKIVAQLVSANVRGEAEFTKAEWEGVIREKQNAKAATDCTQALFPLFLDRFKKK